MMKRIVSFLLAIALGFMSFFSTSLNRVTQIFKGNQQVTSEVTDNTTPPPDPQKPIQAKQAYLPPKADEEDKKRKPRFMKKDERAAQYSKVSKVKTQNQRYEVPRKSRLPQRFTSSQSS